MKIEGEIEEREKRKEGRKSRRQSRFMSSSMTCVVVDRRVGKMILMTSKKGVIRFQRKLHASSKHDYFLICWNVFYIRCQFFL
jgi:hypothetical protein